MAHLVSWLLETLEAWRRTRALRDDMCSPGPAEFEHIMQDLGMRSNHLQQLGAGHLIPEELIALRLKARGLDVEYLQQARAAIYHDLQYTCSNCRSWYRCERDLARGDAETGMRDYCLSAQTIKSLLVADYFN
jgi:hypothetical protein